MRTHKAPEQEVSYLDYLSEEKGKLSIKEDLTSISYTDENGTKVPFEVSEGQINNVDEEVAVLFMQVSAPSHSSVWKNTLTALGIGVGSAIVANPKMAIVSAGKLFNIYTLGAVAVFLGVQHLNVWGNNNIAAGYCADVSLGDDKRQGCSAVRLVKYDLEGISAYCGVIESI
jgi:hypothetical protein